MFQTLIVEDNASYRCSLRELLSERFPCMVIEGAGNGREALTKFTLLAPQLIFMDIRLPDSNGLDLTRQIRADSRTVVVVIITSHNIPEYHDAAFQAGADHFVSKSTASVAQIVDLVYSDFPTICRP